MAAGKRGRQGAMTAAMMEEEGRWRGRRRGPRRVGLRQNKGWPPRATAAVMQATMAATMSEDGSYDGDGSGSSGNGEETVDGRKAPSAARRRPLKEVEGPWRFPAFPRSGGWHPRVCVCRLSRSNLDLCT